MIPTTLLLAVAIAAASPPRVDHELGATVKLGGGTISFVTPSTGLPYFDVAGMTDNFQCRIVGTTKGWTRRYWNALADYLDAVAPEIASHPNSDWGKGWTKISSTRVVGFCNLSVSTRDDTAWLSLVGNRECFGSAGCNVAVASFSVDSSDLNILSAALRENAP